MRIARILGYPMLIKDRRPLADGPLSFYKMIMNFKRYEVFSSNQLPYGHVYCIDFFKNKIFFTRAFLFRLHSSCKCEYQVTTG